MKNVKDKLLKNLISANGEFISGSSLAESLGVSRNAVWKAVKSLEAEGYIIESITAKGYRISGKSNHLSAEMISHSLTTDVIGRELVVFGETDSTNTQAKNLAANGAVHGTTVVADKQTLGRGRLGRSFISPSEKGLYLSIILRPDFSIEAAGLITSIAACAVAEAIEELCGSDVQIKWVNDLYMNGRKICGILTEAFFDMEMNALEMAVIGIGVNVRSIGDSFDDELKSRASSIEDETGVCLERNRLCAGILNHIEKRLGDIETGAFLEEYRRREILTGNMITASVGGSQITGKAIGIDDRANLIVELKSGEVRHLSSGEANLCRLV